MKHILIFSFLIFVTAIKLNAQTDTSKIPADTNYINYLNGEEILLENIFEDSEDSKLLDDLDNLKRNPLDLNTASQEELETIPFINSFISKKIIEYRKLKIQFKTKRELLLVEGITDEIYELIKIYVIVKQSAYEVVREIDKEMYSELNNNYGIIKNTNIRYRTRFQQDLQTKSGFLDGSYPGTKAKIFNQLSFVNSKFNIDGNVTLEKDAGETSLTDFYSAFLELKNTGIVKEIVVGDYSLTFGQGLGMWGSTGYSKGSLAVDAVKKRNIGIKGYSSVNESQFFRGAASTFNIKKFDFTFFYSNNYFDASIDTTLDEVSSFYFDGYHRTISEQNRKNSGRERLFGGRIYFNNNILRLGATYWNSKFSKPVEADSTKNLYSFAGDKADMISFDYDVNVKNLNLYGELARSQSGSIAGLSALQLNFSKTAELIFLYRYYPEQFSPVHSFGFGENNGNTQNEQGFYTGLTLYPYKFLIINTYFDQFKFHYRTYFNPIATQVNDFLFNADWKFDRNILINFRYKNENKEETQTVTDEFGRDTKKIVNRNQMNFRIGFDYKLSDKINIRSRYDYVFVGYDLYGGNNKGSMFYTDFKFAPSHVFTVATRFIFFQTDDYDSRIYEYEDDIRGVMSNTSIYGKGSRWYIMFNYKPFRSLEFYGKYAETYLDGVKSIGTGNDLIQGDINNRLNLGMEIFF
jgi:hypothetical protein